MQPRAHRNPRSYHESGAWVRDAAAAYAEKSAERASSLSGMSAPKTEWPLWEVFVRSRQGLSHKHVGSLHAADATMAISNARDVYTRRQKERAFGS